MREASWMRTVAHCPNIRQAIFFVMLFLGPLVAAVVADEADESDWIVHPSLASDVSCTLLPVALFGTTYTVPQFEFVALLITFNPDNAA